MKKLKVLVLLLFLFGGLNNCNCGPSGSFTDTDAPRVNLDGMVLHNLVLDTIRTEDTSIVGSEFYFYKADTKEFIGCIGYKSFPALANLFEHMFFTHVNALMISEEETITLDDSEAVEIKEISGYINRCPTVLDYTEIADSHTVTTTWGDLFTDEIAFDAYTLTFRKADTAEYEPAIPHEDDGQFLKLAWADIALFDYDDDEFSDLDSTLLLVPYKSSTVLGCVEFQSFEYAGYRMDELNLDVIDANSENFNMDLLDDDTDYQILFVDRDLGGCGDINTAGLKYKRVDKSNPFTKQELTETVITFSKKRIELQFYLAD